MVKLLVSILLLFSSQQIAAQPSHTLCDVLSLALLQNPELGTFSYDMRANDARILQAALRPNPFLDIESENIDTPKFIQTTFLLSQLIELGGKRSARIDVARAGKNKVYFEYEVKKRQLFIDTSLLFIDVLINQQKIAFLEENLKIIQNFSSVVENRVKAGKASIIEQSNFSVLLTTARIDLQNAQTDLRIAKNKLAAQWGEPCNDAYEVFGNLDWIPNIIPLEGMGSLVQNHPQILLTRIECELRQARISLEKSKAYPDINVRGGPRYLKEANKWVWVVGFTIPLPINDRNQGNIYEAQMELAKLERERTAIWVKLLTELNTSYATTQTLFAELALLKNSVLPATQKAYDFSYKGYESARYNYLEIIETERLFRTSKIRYLQALGDYHKALAQLEGLTGTNAIFAPCCEHE